MKIELKKIRIGDLVEGYVDDNEGGVRGYGGRLDIRPPYQREFIYKDAQRDAVIDSIRKGYPLNTMYWSVREEVILKSSMGNNARYRFVSTSRGFFPLRGVISIIYKTMSRRCTEL